MKSSDLDIYAVDGDLTNLLLIHGRSVINGNYEIKKYDGKAWFIQPYTKKRINLEWIMKAPCIKYTNKWGGRCLDYNHILYAAEKKIRRQHVANTISA